MGRLRRLKTGFSFVPVAAEVLESRALLSSAAAAVHAATHHAIAPQTVQTLDFSGSHAGSLSIGIFGAIDNVSANFTANFSTGNTALKVGAHVTANFQATINASGAGYTINSLSGSLSGKIVTEGPLQNTLGFRISAKSSLTMSVIYEGKPMSLKISPRGSEPLLETTFQFQFAQLTAKYSLPKKIFNGDEVVVSFT